MTSNHLDVQFNGQFGRFVRIQLRHEHQALSLAEVEVFRHTPVKDANIQIIPINQPSHPSTTKDKVLTIQHKGAYVARYTITWDEISTDKNGNQTIRSKSWEGNGVSRTSGYVLNLSVKANMKNVRVKIEKATGLFWNWWKPIYDNNLLLNNSQRTITHWGTTLNSKIAEQ